MVITWVHVSIIKTNLCISNFPSSTSFKICCCKKYKHCSGCCLQYKFISMMRKMYAERSQVHCVATRIHNNWNEWFQYVGSIVYGFSDRIFGYSFVLHTYGVLTWTKGAEWRAQNSTFESVANESYCMQKLFLAAFHFHAILRPTFSHFNIKLRTLTQKACK